MFSTLPNRARHCEGANCEERTQRDRSNLYFETSIRARLPNADCHGREHKRSLVIGLAMTSRVWNYFVENHLILSILSFTVLPV